MFYVYYFKNITCTVVQMYLNESLIINYNIIYTTLTHDMYHGMCIFIYFFINFNS